MGVEMICYEFGISIKEHADCCIHLRERDVMEVELMYDTVRAKSMLEVFS